jgi:SAM-dependent methyltransferase
VTLAERDALTVAQDARVLDVGGGDGVLLAELARRGHSGRRERIDTRNGTDAHALPFSDASFDLVFMLRVLAHLHTPALALAEACRVLALGGELVVAANGPGHLAGLLPAGQAALLPLLLPGTRRRSFALSMPVALSVSDQQELARIYGLNSRSTRPLESLLQLAGWQVSRET